MSSNSMRNIVLYFSKNVLFKLSQSPRSQVLLKRRFQRTLSKVPQRLSFILFFFLIFLLHLLIFVIFNSILILISTRCCVESSNIIVSLTTTSTRFNVELPIAIHSLLFQRILPKEIRIYLSNSTSQTNLTLEILKKSLEKYDSSLKTSKRFDDLVRIYWTDRDFGPATKFFPIVKEFLSKTKSEHDQRIFVCDDDHYYSSQTISTLRHYSSRFRRSMIGLRGWRIRKDFKWGVLGKEESGFHIIESFNLFEPYRVGILTANHGYLIRPSFFDDNFFREFDEISDKIRHVDDIWINSFVSMKNVSRFVVPSSCSQIHISQSHTLETFFAHSGSTRRSANEEALSFFKNRWEKDFFYEFHGVNRPQSRWFYSAIDRHWIFLIENLKFIFRFGIF